MKSLKVLSIDMDFFQDVDIETLVNCYPDGHDWAAPMLAAFIWSSHYSNPYQNERLSKVACPESLFNTLKAIIKNQDTSVPVLVSQSHLQIYDFIHEEMLVQERTTLDLVNIDMHHDMFTDAEDKVDCGNWVNAIMRDVPAQVTWISHPLSSELMDDKSGDGVQVIVNSFETIKETQFDAIFLCRSDMWYAPHLDNKFQELVDLLVSRFETTYVSEGLTDRSGCTQSLNYESL